MVCSGLVSVSSLGHFQVFYNHYCADHQPVVNVACDRNADGVSYGDPFLVDVRNWLLVDIHSIVVFGEVAVDSHEFVPVLLDPVCLAEELHELLPYRANLTPGIVMKCELVTEG